MASSDPAGFIVECFLCSPSKTPTAPRGPSVRGPTINAEKPTSFQKPNPPLVVRWPHTLDTAHERLCSKDDGASKSSDQTSSALTRRSAWMTSACPAAVSSSYMPTFPSQASLSPTATSPSTSFCRNRNDINRMDPSELQREFGIWQSDQDVESQLQGDELQPRSRSQPTWATSITHEHEMLLATMSITQQPVTVTPVKAKDLLVSSAPESPTLAPPAAGPQAFERHARRSPAVLISVKPMAGSGSGMPPSIHNPRRRRSSENSQGSGSPQPLSWTSQGSPPPVSPTEATGPSEWRSQSPAVHISSKPAARTSPRRRISQSPRRRSLQNCQRSSSPQTPSQ